MAETNKRKHDDNDSDAKNAKRSRILTDIPLKDWAAAFLFNEAESDECPLKRVDRHHDCDDCGDDMEDEDNIHHWNKREEAYDDICRAIDVREAQNKKQEEDTKLREGIVRTCTKAEQDNKTTPRFEATWSCLNKPENAPKTCRLCRSTLPVDTDPSSWGRAVYSPLSDTCVCIKLCETCKADPRKEELGLALGLFEYHGSLRIRCNWEKLPLMVVRRANGRRAEARLANAQSLDPNTAYLMCHGNDPTPHLIVTYERSDDEKTDGFWDNAPWRKAVSLETLQRENPNLPPFRFKLQSDVQLMDVMACMPFEDDFKRFCMHSAHLALLAPYYDSKLGDSTMTKTVMTTTHLGLLS
jgi:hypothetical protein